MKLQFDPNQKFQLDAIQSVVDLFQTQPSNTQGIYTKLSLPQRERESGQIPLDFIEEVGAIGNNLLLGESKILENLQMIQERNRLEIQQRLAGDALDFDIEMETGTGKTYVYLRTIFELAQAYNLTKFIILVPSVAIREGVLSSINQMREHFEDLYALPFETTVYSGKNPEKVHPFATSTVLQIMVITIDSIRGDKSNRIIHQERDILSGVRPIDFLSATKPILILDEPQNMESDLSQAAINKLNPLCTLRYSATHRTKRNLVYRLDPIDALTLGLVKEIVVSEVIQSDLDNKPYMRLENIKTEPFQAKFELQVRLKDGSLKRKSRNVKLNVDLGDVSKNEAYAGLRLIEIKSGPNSGVEFNDGSYMNIGEIRGDNSDEIYREMIRECIREHLRKESLYQSKGLKVLSLFFVDQVSNYVTYDSQGNPMDGPFAQWFDKILIEERKKMKLFDVLPYEPEELRSAYFATKKVKKLTKWVDSKTGSTQADADAFDLIMRDKTRLLDQEEPVRFIFSHSALREGWDNPNIFQICALRQIGSIVERRQTIGRGLRLPVDQNGQRVHDRGIAQLTVIANESYSVFAQRLQEEYVQDGVSFGVVRKEEFVNIRRPSPDFSLLGSELSERIWNHLKDMGFLDRNGRLLDLFAPETAGFSLKLDDDLIWAEQAVIDVMKTFRMENFIKQKRKRVNRKLNGGVYSSSEFEQFWEKISQNTTYRVHLKKEEIIEGVLKALEYEPKIQPIQIVISKAGLKFERGGIKATTQGQRSEVLGTHLPLPDILSDLQKSTSLTRETIIDILIESKRINEFIYNPNEFLLMFKRCINYVLSDLILEGIEYRQIPGSIYELDDLKNDSLEERDMFLDRLYKVANKEKTDYDLIPIDSGVEENFAKELDSREDVIFFMKLPPKFKIPTPIGFYNPDWALIKSEGEEDRLYFIRETKGTTVLNHLRDSEKKKVVCGEKHFDVTGVDFGVSSLEDNNLDPPPFTFSRKID